MAYRPRESEVARHRAGGADADAAALDDCYYTAKEAARYLAVHEKTIRRKALIGEIRHERIGGRLRFRRTWLEAFATAVHG